MQYYIIIFILVIGICYLLFKLLSQERRINMIKNYDNKQLFSVINQINFKNSSKILGPVTTKKIYRPGSQTKEMKEKVSKLLSPIIKKISSNTGDKFVIQDYEVIIVETDDKHNVKYLIDYFIRNVTNNYSVKLITELFISSSGEINLNFIRDSNNQKMKIPDYIKGNDPSATPIKRIFSLRRRASES